MDKYPLGNRVRIARKQCGLTGEKLSEAINVDPSYLRQIECGRKLPSLQIFISLCRELKVSPNVLLADYLPRPEYEERDMLHELYRTLTPEQRGIIRSFGESVARRMDDGRDRGDNAGGRKN